MTNLIGIMMLTLTLTSIEMAVMHKNLRPDYSKNYQGKGSGGGGGAGSKTADHKKRDLSLSYAATNIDNKEGTRIKTITVIKNRSGGDGGGSSSSSKENQHLAINPDLHKSEDWAKAFHDNFDAYGSIPDVPDIDDLFDFMKKPRKEIEPKIPKTEMIMPRPNVKPTKSTTKNDDELFIMETSTETLKNSSILPSLSSAEIGGMNGGGGNGNDNNNDDDNGEQDPVEKIKGDAELIPIEDLNKDRQNSKIRSQSLSLTNQKLIFNASPPLQGVRQYTDNYIQRDTSTAGYDYARPCAQSPTSSITVTTHSGRTYNLPTSNSSNSGVPYIAPSIGSRRTQYQIQSNGNQPTFPVLNQPGYPINSVIPPLMPALNAPPAPSLPPQRSPSLPTPSNATSGQSPFPSLSSSNQIFFYTSQRPYLAPQFRVVTNSSRRLQPQYVGSIGGYRNRPTSYRINTLGFGGNKMNVVRSRGLKY